MHIFNTLPARDIIHVQQPPPRERAPSRRAMPEDARRQQIRKQLAMPDIRAVSVFQSHLEQGLWRSRHIQALAADPKSQDMFLAIIECTKGLHAARRAPDLTPQQQQKLGSRNTLCLCHSTCPAETQVWMDCVRAAAKAASATQMLPPGVIVAVHDLMAAAQHNDKQASSVGVPGPTPGPNPSPSPSP